MKRKNKPQNAVSTKDKVPLCNNSKKEDCIQQKIVSAATVTCDDQQMPLPQGDNTSDVLNSSTQVPLVIDNQQLSMGQGSFHDDPIKKDDDSTLAFKSTIKSVEEIIPTVEKEEKSSSYSLVQTDPQEVSKQLEIGELEIVFYQVETTTDIESDVFTNPFIVLPDMQTPDSGIQDNSLRNSYNHDLFDDFVPKEEHTRTIEVKDDFKSSLDSLRAEYPLTLFKLRSLMATHDQRQTDLQSFPPNIDHDTTSTDSKESSDLKVVPTYYHEAQDDEKILFDTDIFVKPIYSDPLETVNRKVGFELINLTQGEMFHNVPDKGEKFSIMHPFTRVFFHAPLQAVFYNGKRGDRVQYFIHEIQPQA